MRMDCDPGEDVFTRVPELADQIDPVLCQIDRLLDDDMLSSQVRSDLVRRFPQTSCHGRHAPPVEVILRLVLINHRYTWSCRETEQRVAESLVLRWFCRVYFQSVPDAPTLLRWAQTIQPATLAALNDRVVAVARQARVTSGRTRRSDGTVVQTTIHHPTDSSLLTDGVRVLTRIIRRSPPRVQEQFHRGRDAFRARLRTMRRGRQTLHRLRRRVGADHAAQRQAVYQTLLAATTATVRQVERSRPARQTGREQQQPAAARLLGHLDRTLPLLRQVIDQARQRVLAGKQVPASEKVVSLFEPHTRIIPRHQGGTPGGFGRLVVFDGVEGGIVTRLAVLADTTAEQGQLAPALAPHQQIFGRAPWLVTGDRGVHAAANEPIAQVAGVTHVVSPRAGRLRAMPRAKEHSRSWRRRDRWRAGIEGRRSSVRRDYGLRRCPDAVPTTAKMGCCGTWAGDASPATGATSARSEPHQWMNRRKPVTIAPRCVQNGEKQPFRSSNSY